jgi:ubiquinone/menaquinone biosynthesis C-methylase UbiE
VGIDPAPEMIATARQKAAQKEIEIDFRVGVIEALPFAENSFDVVVSSLMMHHLPNALKTQGLAEIQRVLRPNGHLLIVDFKTPTTFFNKTLLKLLFHGGLQGGLAEISRQVEPAGFHDVAVGNLKLPYMGYISAHANKGA